jgi:hypothetical protein
MALPSASFSLKTKTEGHSERHCIYYDETNIKNWRLKIPAQYLTHFIKIGWRESKAKGSEGGKVIGKGAVCDYPIKKINLSGVLFEF